MGLLVSLLEKRASIENPSTNLSNPAEWLIDWTDGRKTAAGLRVNESTAFALTTVYACVRVLAETIASIPLLVYRRSGRSTRRDRNHYLYELLHDRPNEWQTSFVWRETGQGHLGTWGNFYCRIRRVGGRPVALEPLAPNTITPKLVNRNLYYVHYRELSNGRTVEETYPAEDVIHVPGLGFDGLQGYSPIRKAREAIGLGLALQDFGASWFGNGSRVSGVLSHPAKLKPEAAQQIQRSWQQLHAGPENAHRVAVLEEGMTWTQIGIPPDDAQFLETRKFQVAEIARIYRIPPHMIGDLDRATFSNIEHQQISFVEHTIRPWLVRWEQELNLKLVPTAERGDTFVEFLVDGLLRGDTKTRYEAYSVAIQNRIMTPNEARERENLNPVEGGDELLVPMNMEPAGAGSDEPDPEDRRTSLPQAKRAEIRNVDRRRRVQRSFRRLLEDLAVRLVRIEVDAVRRGLKQTFGSRNAADLTDWVARHYAEHGARMESAVRPLLLTFAEQIADLAAAEIGVDQVEELNEFVAGYARAAAKRYSGSHLGQLLELIDETDVAELVAAIEARLEEWTEKAPGKFAARESVQAGAAFTKAAWAAAGVSLLRWTTAGKNCPLCDELEGKVVGITTPFVRKGETVVPQDGATAPLQARQDYGHPPLHAGCDCSIVPGG